MRSFILEQTYMATIHHSVWRPCHHGVNYIFKTPEASRELAILKASKEMFCIQLEERQQMTRKIKD